MKPRPGVTLWPLMLAGMVAASLLTTCSTELLDEITADIEAHIASKLPKKPEIKVSVDGSELYSGYGFYNFPGKSRIDIGGDGGDPISKTFTVSNLGDGQLTFSVEELSGPGAANFSVNTVGMLSSLEPAGTGTDSTTFSIDYDPV